MGWAVLKKFYSKFVYTTRSEQPVWFNLVNHQQSAIHAKHITFNWKETRSLNNYIALLYCGDNYIVAPWNLAGWNASAQSGHTDKVGEALITRWIYDHWHLKPSVSYSLLFEMPLKRLVSESYNCIIDPANRCPAERAQGKPVKKADKASQKWNPIPDKILAEKLQVWTCRLVAFDNEPVRCNKEHQTAQ